jgi:transcriptional regulator with XRE-family HTH domain
MNHLHTTRAAILTLGRRLRTLRLAAKMSQQELARRSRVTAHFIGQIERAESNSSVASLALIAEALGCHLSDLFQRDTHAPYAYVSIRVDEIGRAQRRLWPCSGLSSRNVSAVLITTANYSFDRPKQLGEVHRRLVASEESRHFDRPLF